MHLMHSMRARWETTLLKYSSLKPPTYGSKRSQKLIYRLDHHHCSIVTMSEHLTMEMPQPELEVYAIPKWWAR